MATYTTATTKNKYLMLYPLHKLNNPTVILNLLSIIALVFPVTPLALLATVFALSSLLDGDFIASLWLLGGPAGMLGLIFSVLKKKRH